MIKVCHAGLTQQSGVCTSRESMSQAPQSRQEPDRHAQCAVHRSDFPLRHEGRHFVQSIEQQSPTNRVQERGPIFDPRQNTHRRKSFGEDAQFKERRAARTNKGRNG